MNMPSLLLIFLSLYCVQQQMYATQIQLAVASRETAAIQLKIIVPNTIDKRLVERVASDLTFTKQCAVSIEYVAKIPSKKEIKAFAANQYPLALVITPSKKADSIEWRLYDTFDARMIAGKECYLLAGSLVSIAHHIADQLWPILTNQSGFFSSKIAYCKVIDGRSKKGIFIADFDGSNEQIFVTARHSVVAPRWNNDPANPLLFYSEYTDTNVRLMSIDSHGKRRIASNFEGINMLPHFASDGKAVVYCASKGRGNGQLYYYQNGITRQLTNNQANNFSPTFAADNATVYFCSDCCKGIPQLFSYNIETGKTEQLTHQGSSIDPHYCAANNQLVYVRSVDGITQIFVYDITADTHCQITYGSGCKQEPVWSACGNYIVYTRELVGKSNLMIYSCALKSSQLIGNPQDNYSSPSWSVCYTHAPFVKDKTC